MRYLTKKCLLSLCIIIIAVSLLVFFPGKSHGKAAGSIVGWGDNDWGQINCPPGNNYVAIGAGVFHSVALKTDGSLAAWENNTWGQINCPAGNDYTAISAGGFHNVALKVDGSLVCWGDNYNGQLNCPAGNNYKAIAAGKFHSVALKADGSLVAWGANWEGQIDCPAGNDYIAIAAGDLYSIALKADGSLIGWGGDYEWGLTCPAGNDYKAIAAGGDHSIALKADGSLVGWGDNSSGQTICPVGNDYVAIAARDLHSLALKADGSLVGWGDNSDGQISCPAGNDYIAIAAGYSHSLGIAAKTPLVGWGANDSGQTTCPAGNNSAAIAAGGYHSIALKADGSLVAWGRNSDGQISCPAGNNFVAIASGGYYSAALKADGSLVAWGDNSSGQTTCPAGNNYVAVAAGYYHSVALKADGSLVAWGNNGFGQLSCPAGNSYVAIAAGGFKTVALKADGSLVAWGDNFSGQTTCPAGNDYTAIAAGGYHSIALKADGSLVGWGDNSDGQTSCPAGNTYVAIAAGCSHSVALKADGSLVGWGDNTYGQKSCPAGNNYVAITAGCYHSVALFPQPTTIVSPESGLSTTEGGGIATFTVALDIKPTADVAIGLSSSNSAEGTVSPLDLTFTPANWDMPQQVTVTGVDDNAVDGSQAYTIVTDPAVSADGNYNGLDPADVRVVNTDNEVPPPADRDGDGISDSGEQGPEGDDPNYDGNGDRIPDWRQCQVSSFTTFASDGNHYLTLEAPEGQCLERIGVFRTFPALPPGVSLPFGYLTFQISGLEEGACTTVTIYLDGEAPQTYYKYGPTPDNPAAHWYEFSFDGETGALASGTTIVLYLCDGKRGDHDLTENGKILEPGGPAAVESRPVLYFPYLAKAPGDATELGIINRKHYAVSGAIHYFRDDGTLLEGDGLSLAALGKRELMSEDIPAEAASAVVSADGNVVGYGRFVSASGQRYAAPGATLLSRRITIPYDQPDPSWNNRIFLFNPAEGVVTITVSDADGNRSETLMEAKQQQVLTLDGVNNPRLIEGSGNIAALEVFMSLVSGGDAASILLGNPDQTELLVPAILFGSGENTGIGLGNPSQDDLVTAFGYAENGEEEEVSLGLLPARSVMTANLSRLFSPDIVWVKIAGVSALETPFGPPPLPLQGLASYWEAGYGKVATVSLNGLKFREGITGVVASGARPTLTLMNPDSTDAAITITAYTGDGTESTTEELTIPAGGTMTSLIGSLAGGSTLESGDYIQIASDRDLYGFETIYADGRMEMLPILK